MPNGKGQMDCCYCVHWQNEWDGYDGAYEQGFCTLYQAEIPSTLPDWIHRICVDFAPNRYFEKYLIPNSLPQRFAWFGIELQKGVLYGFHYNAPTEIKRLKELQQ